MGIIKSLFDFEYKELKRFMKIADQIEAKSDEYEKLTEKELKNKTNELKDRLNNGSTLDDIIVDAFATVREAASRVINAIPFYTRVWRETLKTQEELDAQDGTEAAEYPYKVTSKAYGIKSIQVAIDNAGAKVKYDDNTEMNYAEWKEGETICKVWLEDADSLRTKLEMMKEYKLAGVAAWRLGFENASTWELISKYVN